MSRLLIRTWQKREIRIALHKWNLAFFTISNLTLIENACCRVFLLRRLIPYWFVLQVKENHCLNMPQTHGILKASEEQKMAGSQKQQQNHMAATNTTKLRGYLQVKHNPATRRSRLPRKVRIFLQKVIYVLESKPPFFIMKVKVICNFRHPAQSSANSSYPPSSISTRW